MGYFSGKVSWENTFHTLCNQKLKKTVSSMDPDAPTREGLREGRKKVGRGKEEREEGKLKKTVSFLDPDTRGGLKEGGRRREGNLRTVPSINPDA